MRSKPASKPGYAPSKIWTPQPSQLDRACRLVLDPLIPDAELRTAIFKAVERDDLESAVDRVDSLVHPPEDTYYQEHQQNWRHERRFLPALLKSMRLGYMPAGRALANALEQLVEQGRRTKLEQARPEIVIRAWRQYVFGQDGAVDKRPIRSYITALASTRANKLIGTGFASKKKSLSSISCGRERCQLNRTLPHILQWGRIIGLLMITSCGTA
jgi:hypothetical protein